jgi:hypothetical protein
VLLEEDAGFPFGEVVGNLSDRRMIDSRKHGTRSDRSWDRNGSYKLSWSRASEVSSDCALADDIVRRLIDSRLEVDNIDFWQPSTLSNQVLLVSSRNYEMLTHYGC